MLKYHASTLAGNCASSLHLLGLERLEQYFLDNRRSDSIKNRIRPVNTSSAVKLTSDTPGRWHVHGVHVCMTEAGRIFMSGKKHDAEKARYWERTIREAVRSGASIQEFCQQRKLQKSQFYWWRRRLEKTRQRRTMRTQSVNGERTSFALVSDDQRTADAGIELVLGDGRRLRISKGVDEATLRAVLAAVGPEGC